MTKLYRVIRFYRTSYRRSIIATGRTLDQAQAHCSRPNTHGLSNPRRPGTGRCYTHGIQKGERCLLCDECLEHDWFDGYEAQ